MLREENFSQATLAALLDLPNKQRICLYLLQATVLRRNSSLGGAEYQDGARTPLLTKGIQDETNSFRTFINLS